MTKKIDTSPIESIVSTLEHAQARTAMYLYPPDHVEAVTGFLSGFDTACQMLGYRYDTQTYETVFTKRGWYRFENKAELLSKKTRKNMKDSGMSDEEIINELFAIDIDCWKSLLDSSVPDSKP